jgi:hypothetical protein
VQAQRIGQTGEGGSVAQMHNSFVHIIDNVQEYPQGENDGPRTESNMGHSMPTKPVVNLKIDPSIHGFENHLMSTPSVTSHHMRSKIESATSNGSSCKLKIENSSIYSQVKKPVPRKSKSKKLMSNQITATGQSPDPKGLEHALGTRKIAVKPKRKSNEMNTNIRV